MLIIHVYTSDVKLLTLLDKIFIIKKVFFEKEKSNNSLIRYLKNNKISYKKISKLIQINKINFKSVDLGLSFGFGYIFRKSDFSKYKFGIWNIHPGDLPNYRGRHPITWAFLNNEKYIGVSIHQINEKIDMGYLIGKKYVKRDKSDDGKKIMKKIYNILPSLLKKSLENYKKRNFYKLSKGKYFPPLLGGINIPDTKKVKISFLKNALNAQKYFSGVKIEGRFYKNFKDYHSKIEIKKNHKIINLKNKKKLIIY